MSNFEPLLTALRNKKAQSSSGFEGLLRDLLKAISGRDFMLSKGGEQGGTDGRTPFDLSKTCIAFEAKRFGANSKLQFDEVEAKLVEAIRTKPEMDVWILVISKEMKEQDWTRLRAYAEQHGVTAICLDWRTGPGNLPLLAALCAAANHVSTAHLPKNVGASLKQAAKHPEFAGTVDNLRQLLVSPEVGFPIAREATYKWIRKVVSSRSDARFHLRSDADIRGPGVNYVVRKGPNEAMNNWLNSSDVGPAVVIGDGGRGKTWATLSWSLNTFSAADGPMFVILPARDANPNLDPELLIATAINRATTEISIDRLVQRVRRWGALIDRPRFALLIDDLNQAWSTDWDALVRKFQQEPWRDSVRLLLTSRTQYWRDDIQSLKGASHKPFSEITVLDFDKPELTEFLRLNGTTLEEIPRGLHKIVHVPRLAKLALTLQSRFRDSEDITATHLVLEDWRSRIDERGSAIRLTDEKLLDVIAELGREALPDTKFSITQSRLAAILGKESGRDSDYYQSTISEIVEGHWLKASDLPHSYKINEDLLPYAIGLDLAKQVESLTDPLAIQEIIAEYNEHLRGDGLGVAILRAATAMTFIQRRATREARSILLKAWLESQNFGTGDFSEFWPLIAIGPEVVIDYAEGLWLSDPYHYHEKEVLCKGLANATKWQPVLQLLAKRMPRWCGTFQFDRFHEKHSSIPYSEERASYTRQHLDAWKAAETQYGRPLAQNLWECMATQGITSALTILSYVPRLPFIDTILTILLSRSVMGEDQFVKELEWVLRINEFDHDELEAALMGELRNLVGLKNVTGNTMATFLGRAIGTPQAAALAPGFPPLKFSYRAQDERRGFVRNGTTIEWRHRGPVDQKYVAGTQWLNALSYYGPHLTLHLSRKASSALKTLTEMLAPEMVDSKLNSGSLMLSGLARWAPEKCASLMKELYLSAARDPMEMPKWLMDALPGCFLFFDDGYKASLLRIVRRKLKEPPLDDEKQENRRLWRLHTLSIAAMRGKPAREQIAELFSYLPRLLLDKNIVDSLSDPTTADVDFVFNQWIANGDVITQRLGLNYLNNVKLPELPESAKLALELIKSPDKNLRGDAMEFIWRSDDQRLGEAVALSDWSFEVGQESTEAIGGTLLICKFGKKLRFEDAVKRIHRPAIGKLVEKRGLLPSEVQAFRDELWSLIDLMGKTRTYTVNYGNDFKAEKAMKLALSMNECELIYKLRDAAQAGLVFGLFDSFPLVRFIRAAFELDVVAAVDIWRAVQKTHRRHSMRAGDLDAVIFDAPLNDAVDAVWREVVGEANTDKDLFTRITNLLLNGQEAWIASFAYGELLQKNPAHIARGITVAGFLHNTPVAQALWSIIDAVPLEGWLDHIREKAKRTFIRNSDGCHWLTEFLATEDPEKAYGYFQLFHDLLDDRFIVWARPLIAAAKPDLSEDWLFHIDATEVVRRDRRKTVLSERDSALFYTPVSRELAPWS
ncbi:MAG: hypothetical protein OJJ21_22220 [Ferrovibrio sp.]|uniref:hypothetical protein n=1 Tax=Ferrovibrio sp. TaxID=1917215 RepID=UPI00262560EA|nr:hypothetical protein [Ferrovibrio sp.]MCW0236330.1 hypothetical protein [Ferrovibrio sp.]